MIINRFRGANPFLGFLYIPLVALIVLKFPVIPVRCMVGDTIYLIGIIVDDVILVLIIRPAFHGTVNLTSRDLMSDTFTCCCRLFVLYSPKIKSLSSFEQQE